MAVSSQKLSNFVRFALDGEFSSGDWTCTLSTDATTADCTLPTLAMGADTSLDLGLTPIGGALAADAETSFTVTSGDQTVSYSVRTGVEVNEEGVDGTYSAEGHMAAIHVGATLMGCDRRDSQCTNVMDFAAAPRDQQVQQQRLGHEARSTRRAALRNSATTTLTIPDGATVKYALLEWSANRWNGTDNGVPDAFDGRWSSAPHRGAWRLRLRRTVTADSVTVN